MIILMGVAGAGKSLQGKLFANELGYEWVSTGEIFRSNLSEERKKELLTGKLIEDDETIELVEQALKDIGSEKNVVLDGFPRTMKQVQWIMDQIKSGKIELKAVFNIEATKNVVRKRLLQRGRADDTEDIIEKRFVEYETKTLPIINYFKQSGINVYDINGDQAPEAVHDSMISKIK